MSLLNNIEIWKNQRPRVCSFDLEDYCNYGFIGNNTTGMANIPTSGYFYPTGLSVTANTTGQAYFKAFDEFIMATLAHYIDSEDLDANPYVKCITEDQWNTIQDFLHGPEGPYAKYVNFYIKSSLFFNSLNPTAYKRTDVETTFVSYKHMPYEGPWTTEQMPIVVDYSTLLYPTRQAYFDSTKSMRDLVQSLKTVMMALNNDTFPIYQP